MENLDQICRFLGSRIRAHEGNRCLSSMGKQKWYTGGDVRPLEVNKVIEVSKFVRLVKFIRDNKLNLRSHFSFTLLQNRALGWLQEVTTAVDGYLSFLKS